MPGVGGDVAWEFEVLARDAFFVLDPGNPQRPPSAHERRRNGQDIARAHVGYLLAGMGFSELASQLLVEHVWASIALWRQFLGSDGDTSAAYLRRSVGPFGVLPFSIAQARALAQTMPERDPICRDRCGDHPDCRRRPPRRGEGAQERRTHPDRSRRPPLSTPQLNASRPAQ